MIALNIQYHIWSKRGRLFAHSLYYAGIRGRGRASVQSGSEPVWRVWTSPCDITLHCWRFTSFLESVRDSRNAHADRESTLNQQRQKENQPRNHKNVAAAFAGLISVFWSANKISGSEDFRKSETWSDIVIIVID